MTNFNGVLADIETVIGTADTLKIAMEFGGTEIVIPKKPKEGGLLVKLIGLKQTEKLAQDFGSGKILIPMGHWRGFGYKKVKAAKMLAAGCSAEKIARYLDIHIKTVQRVKQKDYGNLPLIEYIEEQERRENEQTLHN